MSYGDSPNHSLTTTYYVPSNSKTGSYRTGNVIEDVLQSFVPDTEPEQQLAYKDLEHIKKLDLVEIDLKLQMAMLYVRVYKFEQKARRKIDFDKKESARFNKQKVRCYKCQQRGHFARECRSKGENDKQRYSSFKVKEIRKKEEDSKALITVDTLVDWSNHDSKSDEVIAAKEFGMIASCDSTDAIKAGANKLYILINGANSEEANTLGDAGEFALVVVTSEVHNCPFGCNNKYNELSKLYDALNKQNNDYFIQDQAYKNLLKTLENQKRVLQRNQLTLKDKIRVLSIELENTSNLLKHSERISADCETVKKDLQTNLDNHLSERVRWDDSAFSVFTTTSEDVEGRPTFHSDKSSEVNINDLASSDSGLKSSEHKPTNSSCASTSVNEAESDSNFGTPIKEPINVYDLPTDRPQPVPTGTPKVKPVLTGKPKATSVPTGRPKGTPVLTGEPKATPVPT
nr:hypothetical protein [Tanacetum cinerariifolium]